MNIKDFIYVRKCLGQYEKPIDIYKIRTMCLDADKQLEELIGNGLDSFGKIKEDKRILPLGKILRRYWFDELPQLYNLKRGDIKLVGIRPMNEINWELYPDELMKKALQQKPGLMAIDYAFPQTNNFDDKINRMNSYLNQWNENPDQTDKEYFCKIIQSIIFKGVRSS